MNSITTTAPAKMLAAGSSQGKTRQEDLLRDGRGRIRTKDPRRDRTLHLFLLAFAILGVLALVGMKLDMEQLIQGVGEIPTAIGKLAELDFSQVDITFTSLLESVAVAILSTVYSMLDARRRELSINLIKKLCDGLDMSLGTFFSAQVFDELEQEIR